MDYYPLSDLLYRTVALTDTDKDVVEAYDTDAYGNTLVYSGPGNDDTWFTDDDVTTDDPTCRFVFTGREYDYEIGIYCYRARYFQQVLGRFSSREPMETKSGPGPDAGLNVLEYVASAPTVSTDPSGAIIIGMGGFLFLGQGEVQGMGQAIRAGVNAEKGHVLRRGQGEAPPVMRIGCMGWDINRVIQDLRSFRERKDADVCWHEQAVLVGYSDGATTIWRLFNQRGNDVREALRSNWGGFYHVAHVSLIDMVHLGDYKGLSQPGKETPFSDLGILLSGDNFYQQDPRGWKGYRIRGGSFGNFLIHGVAHDTIVNGWWLQHELPARAQESYVRREPYGSPDVPRNPIVD